MDGFSSDGIGVGVERGLPAAFRPQLTSILTPGVLSSVTTTPGTPQLLLRASPARISFVMLRSPTSAGFLSISPTPTPMTGGVRVDGPGGFAIVSQDVWFSLTTYDWYIDSQNPETVQVIDMSRNL